MGVAGVGGVGRKKLCLRGRKSHPSGENSYNTWPATLNPDSKTKLKNH